MKDFSRYLGCESVEQRRARTLAEKLETERKYAAARDALDAFEESVQRLVEDKSIRIRRTELRQARQVAINAMVEAREAFFFAHRVTRIEKSTRPPEYKPEADKHDGSWTRR